MQTKNNLVTSQYIDLILGRVLVAMEKNHTILDDLDVAILSCLQQDGRMSFTEIADQLKVSVGTARTRLNRLSRRRHH